MATPIKDQGKTKLVTLASPIIKDEQAITEIELTKPHSGHLRGVSLFDVCNADFDTGSKVLPKISLLTERDLLNLEPENWAPLLTGLASFFVNTEA